MNSGLQGYNFVSGHEPASQTSSLASVEEINQQIEAMVEALGGLNKVPKVIAVALADAMDPISATKTNSWQALALWALGTTELSCDLWAGAPAWKIGTVN